MPQTLEAFHAEFEAMIAKGQALVVARDPATAGYLKRGVADSMLLVASYQLYVHRQVFAPLLDQGDPAVRARANELKVECIALTEDLRSNVKDFLANDGPLDWDRTAGTMAWFNGRLLRHIAEVRELMSPDLSDRQHAALVARRTGPVGAVAAVA